MNAKYYLVEYAYPTSTTAKKFGHERTGCYTVVLCPDTSWNGWENVAGFAKREDAEDYADELGLPQHPIKNKATV